MVAGWGSRTRLGGKSVELCGHNASMCGMHRPLQMFHLFCLNCMSNEAQRHRLKSTKEASQGLLFIDLHVASSWLFLCWFLLSLLLVPFFAVAFVPQACTVCL